MAKKSEKKKVVDELAEMKKKQKEMHKKLKAWASGENAIYDENGMRIGGK